MEVCIDSLHICQGHLLPENHLVECSNKESVKESPMEDSKPNHTPDEPEEIQVLRVDARMRVDLEGIVVVRRIFEKAVERIKHLVR